MIPPIPVLYPVQSCISLLIRATFSLFVILMGQPQEETIRLGVNDVVLPFDTALNRLLFDL